jgi:hypothetical protein
MLILTFPQYLYGISLCQFSPAMILSGAANFKAFNHFTSWRIPHGDGHLFRIKQCLGALEVVIVNMW